MKWLGWQYCHLPFLEVLILKSIIKAIKETSWTVRLLIVIGISLCSIPLVSSIHSSMQQNNMISTYESKVKHTDKAKINEQIQKAHNYNDMLFQTMGASVGDIDTDILSDESYENILNLTGKGIMGSIEIPKIGVNLPIYHGTSDDVLSNGVGHLQNSSFPVGGENTRTVLTGHRGLPNAKLFTRLDELKKDDLFYIRVGNKTLAYQIYKIEIVKKLFQKNKFSKEECYDLLTSITFFEKEFYKLDSRTMSILKSEITRITNCFISDYQVSKTFNPTQIEQNFYGLEEILSKGKIVVLNMNIAEYKNLSKIIAAYLKLDFQSEVLSRLAQNNKNKTRPVAFISDEYHEYITETDADFFAQSREAKCINIVATQSYTSLLKTLNDESILKVVIQNLINKIWFRTDDTYTIEEVQKQIGKEEKEKISKSISENAKETKYSYVTKTFKSTDSNISESISSTYEKDYVFDTKFFTQELETFVALAFLSNGNKIIKPQKLKLIPYFKKGCDDNS